MSIIKVPAERLNRYKLAFETVENEISSYTRCKSSNDKLVVKKRVESVMTDIAYNIFLDIYSLVSLQKTDVNGTLYSQIYNRTTGVKELANYFYSIVYSNTECRKYKEDINFKLYNWLGIIGSWKKGNSSSLSSVDIRSMKAIHTRLSKWVLKNYQAV